MSENTQEDKSLEKEKAKIDEKEKTKEKEKEKKKSKSNLKIIEWRFNQLLGEKLTYEQIKEDPENESYLVTDIKFSNDGQNVVVADKGGRVIIFKRIKEKEKTPKLIYYYEYSAQEHDFDSHKSIEYSEEIKGLQILPSSNYKKLNILTAGYRIIKLDRIYEDIIPEFDTNSEIPKFTSSKKEIRAKNKKQFCNYNNSEDINSLSLNPDNPNNFISSDESRVYLWDINRSEKDLYTPVDIEPKEDNIYPEKITKSTYMNYNPHIFIYGTNKGNTNVCDLRTSSDRLKFEASYKDIKSDMTSLVSNSILCIHDICSSLNNKYSFATRNYLSINLWDIRKQDEPHSKIVLYEPIINNLSYLYKNNYINDKFSLSSDNSGQFLLTGGYNNMFHVIDTEQRLNTQIIIDDSDDKLMNTNVIRKINSKGSCFYKKDDIHSSNINFSKKIQHQAFSPIENYSLMIVYNCIYSYSGNLAKKK